MSQTSLDELYSRLGAVVLRATGRKWYRRAGIQAQPVGPFATLFIEQGAGLEKEVVETVLRTSPLSTGELFAEIPWGTSELRCSLQFNRNGTPDPVTKFTFTALQDAHRFRQALRLTEREWDLWDVCALSGGVTVQDISGAFRADVEPRADVKFNLWANLVDPLPLADVDLFDIDTDRINVIHVGLDGTETTVPVDVVNPTPDS